MFQGAIPWLNPDAISSMSWDLALHTAASFVTNTNQQHYSGQAQLSYFAHLFAIVTMQFVTPAVGIAALLAILRGLMGGRNAAQAKLGQARDVGNYYVDLTRAITRVLMPLAFVLAVLLTSQGVPSTFEGSVMATPLDSASTVSAQRIPRGPVASMVAIKQLGTNGGGWYGPNSSVPLENPTPFSNMLQSVAIILLPVALLFMLGYFTGHKRFAIMIVAVMTLISASFTALVVHSENQPNAAFVELAAPGANYEGKEVRFGASASALWGTLTTQTSNGSVNAMHDSFNPLGGAANARGDVHQRYLRRCGRRAYQFLAVRYPRGVHCRPDGRAHAGDVWTQARGQGNEACSHCFVASTLIDFGAYGHQPSHPSYHRQQQPGLSWDFTSALRIYQCFC